MKKSIVVLLFLLSAIALLQAKPAFVNHGERYFTFQINDRSELDKLTRIISIDQVKGKSVFAYANQTEWNIFTKQGYDITLLYHPSTLIEPRMMSNERDYTTFDAYPTYDQYVSMMTAFATNYPNICQLYTLGTLASGRKLLFVHISSNVATPAAKPEVMYTSSIHGDELTGAICMLHLINELLTKYGTDPRLTNMVNNLDIWINPLANPDGTYAGGNNTVSGATRGNHNGVDMNRNFRDPVVGYPSTQELEVQLFQTFADTHHFVQVANFHGGAEVFNYPWDDWTSATKTHPDAAWFETEGRAYVDTARVNYANYMTDTFSDGVTEGGDWYTITGGRQDYTNYFSHGREVTIELSTTKTLPASQLLTYWNYNYKSLVKYLEAPYYAIRGTVTNGSGAGLAATITVNSHDDITCNTQMITDPAFGDYYRMIAPGTWSLTFSAVGYVSQTINNVVATANTPTYLNVVMERLMSPPTNVQAAGGNSVVLLTWTAPGALPAGGYKIYRNSSLLTTVSSAATSYSDSAVTNGTSYSYYLVSIYTDPSGESSASTTVTATPNAAPPVNLVAVAGNLTVGLTWSAPVAGSPSGYNVYRNSVLITPSPLTVTNYTDNGVVNGVTYSYYVTALYSSPAAESVPSNTVMTTPNATTIITIGTGVSTQTYPIDRYYNYSAYETIYLQSEIAMTGNINKIGFYKSSGSDVGAITSVTIYMQHTSAATLATGTYSLTGYTQVYSGSYTNDASTGWMVVTLDTPFAYNNTNNLQVLIVKGYQSYLSTGYPFWTYTSTSTNYRARMNRSDTAAPTSLTRSYYRANVRLYLTPPVVNPGFSLSNSSLDFGNVIVGQSTTRSFTITNTGGGSLTGTITTPSGYTVALASKGSKESRTSLAYSVDAGTPKTYTVTFLPTQTQVYAGNIGISSNDPLHPSNTISVTGVGQDPAHALVNPTFLSNALNPGTSGSESLSISNTGDIALNYTLSISYLSRAQATSAHRGFERDMNWLSVTPSSGSIAADNIASISVGYNASGLTSGLYQGIITLNSNDPMNPMIEIPVDLTINPVTTPIGVLLSKQETGTLLSWDAVPYAGIYHVYRAVYPNGSYVKITDVTATSYLDESIDSNTHFYYITAE